MIQFLLPLRIALTLQPLWSLCFPTFRVVVKIQVVHIRWVTLFSHLQTIQILFGKVNVGSTVMLKIII